jgi:hypothetical protein
VRHLLTHLLSVQTCGRVLDAALTGVAAPDDASLRAAGLLLPLVTGICPG